MTAAASAPPFRTSVAALPGRSALARASVSWTTRKKKPAPSALSRALSRLVRWAYSPNGIRVAPDVGDHHEERRARRMGNAEGPGRGDELARVPEGDGRREGDEVAGEDQQRGESGQRVGRASGHGAE